MIIKSGIRQHLGSFAGIFVSTLAAVILLTGLGVVLESGLRGGYDPVRYSAADVIVGGQQSSALPEDLAVVFPEQAALPQGAADSISALNNVAKVIPDFTIQLSDNGAAVTAHNWASTSITNQNLLSGKMPQQAGDVVVGASDPHAHLGDSLVLSHGGAPATYTVVGTASEPPSSSGSAPERQVFLSDEAAAALTGGDHDAKTLAVFAKDGVSAQTLAANIQTQAPGVDTYTGKDRGTAEFLDAGAGRGTLVAFGSSFGGTALLIALFLVAAALSLSLHQRQRDFALLRTIGSTPGQLRSLILGEVFVVSAAAGVIGVGPGYLLAQILKNVFSSNGLIPPGFAFTFSPWPGISAVVLVVLTVLVVANIVAARFSKVSPIQALTESSTTPAKLGTGRLITGIVLTGAGLLASASPLLLHGTAAIAAPAAAGLLLIVAVGLLGPKIAGAGVSMFGRLLRTSRTPGVVLAHANSTGNARRLAAAVVPLALGIGLGLVQLGTSAIVANEAQVQVQDGITANLLVTNPGFGFSAKAVESIKATSGVTVLNAVAVSGATIESIQFGDPSAEQYALQGIDPLTAPATMDLAVKMGSLADLQNPLTVALSTDVAQDAGAKLGDTVNVRLGDGTPIKAKLVATYGRGLGFGAVTVSNDLVRAHTNTGLDTQVLINVDPSKSDQVAAGLSNAGFVVGDPHTAAAQGAKTRSADSFASSLALFIILGYVGLAVVNTLVVATLERRREFALLRLIGSNVRQIYSMMAIEAVMIAILAAVLGVAVAFPALAGISFAVSGQPWPNLSSGTLVVIGVMSSLAVVAIGFATTLALRASPIAEIGSRE
ncbi:FtsX-like permease family protein [Arthrobacter cryoconiti]|uniref:FtsX-like permease family protein n=1 Tax=Arthrobacter cryoconiti TaxID=748907 RepID=A0ABV8QZF6_9MICC|nr:FtsX-like permease family protein [Arthrobacter cryoconiti]MCC9068208.1 FtsX-like permease family protein [Arthrobacter cryoconiti]